MQGPSLLAAHFYCFFLQFSFLTRSLLKMMQTFDENIGDCVARLGLQRGFILERMVVDPAYQGQGVGSAAVAAALAPLDQPVILTTQLQRNVTFYERLGFEVVNTQQFGGSTEEYAYGFKSWTMFRQKPQI